VNDRKIQFKYGDREMYRYSIGGTLAWGGGENDGGVAGAARVRVEGNAESEAWSACGFEDDWFHIILEGDVISEVAPVPSESFQIPPTETYVVEEL
jgi:hypothetical protein